MANIYISPSGNDSTGTGTSGNPYKTLSKAHTVASAGDTIYLKDGTYTGASNSIAITKNNLTVRAENAHAAIFDGGFSWTQVDAKAWPAKYFNWLTISANNVTVRDIVFQNIPGRGIQVDSCESPTIHNNVFYCCYMQGINCASGGKKTTPRITGCTVTDNQVYFASLSWFAGNISGAPDPAQGAIRVGTISTDATHSATVSGNRVSYCFGEGFDIGKFNWGSDAYPILVENNTSNNCNHVLLYMSLHSHHVVCRNNTVYNVNNATITAAGKTIKLWSSGLTSRDEQYDSDPAEKLPGYNGAYNSHDNKFYNNLSVNCHTNAIGEGDHTRIYYGFNTFVGGPATDRTLVILGSNKGNHLDCLFENNIVENTNGLVGVISHKGDWVFRSNVYNKDVGAPFTDNGGEYGNIKLKNPNVNLQVTGLTKALTYAAFNPTDNFVQANYKPTSASSNVIGKANDRGAANNVTAPAYPFSYDMNEDARGADPDRGAIEYDGASYEEVTASFTMKVGGVDVTTVEAGTAVSLDDTSTVGGAATIASRVWTFGDGTPQYSAPNGNAFDHTWANAGVYTVKVTVTSNEGQTDVEEKTLTVKAKESTVNSIVDVTQAAMNTSTGNQTVTLALDNNVPVALAFYVTSATAANTLTDHAALSVGFWASDGGGRCDVFRSDDNEADTDTRRGYHEPEVIVLYDASGAVEARAEVSSVAANSVTINITDAPPAAYLMTIVAFGGEGTKAMRRTVKAGIANSVELVSTAFAPRLIFAASGWTDSEDAVESSIDFGYGFAWREAVTASIPFEYVQARLNYYHGDAQAAGAPAFQVNIGEVCATKTAGASADLRASVRVVPASADGRTVSFQVLRNDIGSTLNALLIDTGDIPGVVKAISTPTTTGVMTVTESDFTDDAGFVMGLLSQAQVAGASTGSPAGNFGIFMTDGSQGYTMAVYEESGAATTNGGSYVSTAATALTHTGTELEEAAVALGTYGGYGGSQWTFGTSSGVSRYWPILMLMVGNTPSLPTAEFSVPDSERNIIEGSTVNFTDLSTGNGSTITAWAWDFGDDGTSTEQNPTHTYTTAGTKTVSLTVTTAVGSATVIKIDYITVTADEDNPSKWRVQLHGPFKPLSITEVTANHIGLYMDEADPATHTHKLDAGAIPIKLAEDTQATALPPSGYAWLTYDASSKKLVIKLADGGKVEYTGVYTAGTGGASDPDPTAGVFNGAIAASADDAQEGSGTMTLTDLSIGMTAGTRNGGFRFRNVTIPQGATITSAVLQFYVVTNDDPVIDIYGEDTANSVAFTTDASDISNRTKTTAVVNWDEDNIGTGAYKNTPDVAAIVQEIVNRTDWQSGNAMTFILDGLASPAVTSVSLRAYDYADGAYAAKLVVNYTV